MKRAPYFYDAHFGILNCDLCVSHIDEITVCPDTFIPNPDIGYILVLCISAHARIYVSFKINAIGVGANRIVPAIYCGTLQCQSLADRSALRVRNPVVYIKGRFRFRLRLEFWFSLNRWGWWFRFLRNFRCLRCFCFLWCLCSWSRFRYFRLRWLRRRL